MQKQKNQNKNLTQNINENLRQNYQLKKNIAERVKLRRQKKSDDTQSDITDTPDFRKLGIC